MKRENLDFLENEQVEKVMALYGKAVAKKDSEIETLKTDKKESADFSIRGFFSLVGLLIDIFGNCRNSKAIIYKSAVFTIIINDLRIAFIESNTFSA